MWKEISAVTVHLVMKGKPATFQTVLLQPTSVGLVIRKELAKPIVLIGTVSVQHMCMGTGVKMKLHVLVVRATRRTQYSVRTTSRTCLTSHVSVDLAGKVKLAQKTRMNARMMRPTVATALVQTFPATTNVTVTLAGKEPSAKRK